MRNLIYAIQPRTTGGKNRKILSIEIPPPVVKELKLDDDSILALKYSKIAKRLTLELIDSKNDDSNQGERQ